MLVRIGYDIAIEVSAPTPMLLMLYVHPERMKDLRAPERLITQPAIDVENYTDSIGNRCAKIVAPPGLIRLYYDNVIEDSGLPEPVFPTAEQLPVQAHQRAEVPPPAGIDLRLGAVWLVRIHFQLIISGFLRAGCSGILAG